MEIMLQKTILWERIVRQVIQGSKSMGMRFRKCIMIPDRHDSSKSKSQLRESVLSSYDDEGRQHEGRRKTHIFYRFLK
jgi:hypothetical protein